MLGGGDDAAETEAMDALAKDLAFEQLPVPRRPAWTAAMSAVELLAGAARRCGRDSREGTNDVHVARLRDMLWDIGSVALAPFRFKLDGDRQTEMAA